MKIRIIALWLVLAMLLSGCSKHKKGDDAGSGADFGSDDKGFGESVDSLGVYKGYFDGESTDINVSCVSGTAGAYELDGTTLRFTEISEDSVYSVTGRLRGNIVIDVGDICKFDLELCGVSLVSETECPITVLSGDEVGIKAKKDTENYIYDKREAVDSSLEGVYSGAIHSEVDLEIGGKGSLKLISENNNGIHTKDDLQIKNLSLLVMSVDNALKGNDSVEIIGGTLTLIATGGDGIKTLNSDISEMGNQRGTVTVSGGTCEIYAACDGIDAAYDTVIDTEACVNIYTDKYSNYSKVVTAVSDNEYYIRFTSALYSYSVKYYNSDSDYLWVNATYHSEVQGGRSTYYYYSFPKSTEYSKMQFFIYSSDMEQGQDAEYLVASDYLEINTSYDTFALSARGNQLTYSWTNYTTNIQEGGFGIGGPGGVGEGNTDKGDHSTKGIKAANQIMINGGVISIKSYDDALHANADTVLENGESPLGNITVNGGTLALYSNDDGVHADGAVNINAGVMKVVSSYEGIEGAFVNISGGSVSVSAKDDGVNATTTQGSAISVSGGCVYIYCGGDGIDSNSRTSYGGIAFSGGNTVVISTSGGNSAIDTEQGYSYTGGYVIAIMPRGGMASEATHCQSFSENGKYTQLSLTEGEYLTVKMSGSTATVRMPLSISAYVIVLGDSSASIKTKSSASSDLDDNGVSWD